jgi:hypothetical protein
MKAVWFRCCLLWTAVSFSCLCRAFAADSADIAERLHHVEALNRIDDASVHPWHLKLSFQLVDAKGHPSEQGTIEEWWKSPFDVEGCVQQPVLFEHRDPRGGRPLPHERYIFSTVSS